MAFALLTGCATANYAGRSNAQQFIQQMADQQGFDRDQLTHLFSQVKPNKKIIRAISKPHETLPWPAYRAIFVTADRAQAGALFWRQHAPLLNYAAQKYGVAPEIIVAILGVETRYGQHAGSFSALEALSTLAFNYPPRAAYFRGELQQYLLLTRDLALDPLQLRSSYAGALGEPQFMPSSYRHYAISYNSDGHPNLFTNWDDVIVSVGNYFKANGWEKDGLVALPARLSGEHYSAILHHGYKPAFTLTQLAQAGVYPAYAGHLTSTLALKQTAGLLALPVHADTQHWLTFHNFYVITRYNTSPLYAMAVYQLSQLIKTHYVQLPH
jgi:membrane-bound lytic murein transglycosylase B